MDREEPNPLRPRPGNDEAATIRSRLRWLRVWKGAVAFTLIIGLAIGGNLIRTRVVGSIDGSVAILGVILAAAFANLLLDRAMARHRRSLARVVPAPPDGAISRLHARMLRAHRLELLMGILGIVWAMGFIVLFFTSSALPTSLSPASFLPYLVLIVVLVGFGAYHRNQLQKLRPELQGILDHGGVCLGCGYPLVEGSCPECNGELHGTLWSPRLDRLAQPKYRAIRRLFGLST